MAHPKTKEANPDIQAGIALAHGRLKAVREAATAAAQKMAVPETRQEGEDFATGMALGEIVHGTEGIISEMARAGVFRKMSPARLFELALRATQTGRVGALEKIVESGKRFHPLHPDLTTYRTEENKTIGHIAAALDQKEVTEWLIRKAPESVELQDSLGENMSHTASRHGSWQCLETIMDMRPGLLAKRNLEGQRPQDLEGGEMIITRMGLEGAEQAELEEENRKQVARKVLQLAAATPPKKRKTPAITIEKRGKQTKNISPEFP
jgi:hypothetical protein